ncbi:sensor domain-containing protein [Nocardia stercoris]|uniref:Sensor domain-containing protein n=1 Tax=Nocardia stercoris TaxID=2483361 RepID=A0A3M2LCB6_9NOCA|nr:sensor domain-containing protein [Nocardia stercoris]RMI35167.1 sensor domain-containing protein [Nocardia stercoris]
MTTLLHRTPIRTAAAIAAVLTLAGCGPDEPAATTATSTPASSAPAQAAGIDASILTPAEVDGIVAPAKAKTTDPADYAAAAADYVKDQLTTPADALDGRAGIAPQTCATVLGIGYKQVFGANTTAFRYRQIDKGDRQNTSSYEALGRYAAPDTTALKTVVDALQACNGKKIPAPGPAGASYLVDKVHTDANSAAWTFHVLNPQVVDRDYDCVLRVAGNSVLEIELASGDAGAVADLAVRRANG